MDLDVLCTQLKRSRELGFLGPGPVDAHLTHSLGFVAALEGVSGTVVDLGSGGGVPGLVVAVHRPDLDLVLVDSMAGRCRFLRAALVALGSRATVVEARAELVGRGPLRGTAAAVIARSFGPPAVTAECGAPLLRIGGQLIVSEPPDVHDRWPAGALEPLGLEPAEGTSGPPVLQRLVQVLSCPDRFPRRVGLPAKRPLF